MKAIGILVLLAMFTMSAARADDKATAKKATAKAATAAPAAAATTAKVLDINSASKEELEGLPVIGKAKAAAIIAGRPFKGKDDLVTKKVLSAAEYAKIKDLIIAKQSK